MPKKDWVFDKDAVYKFVDTVIRAQKDGNIPESSYPCFEPLSKERTIGSEAHYVRAILDVTANVVLPEASEEAMKARASKLSFYGVGKDLVNDFVELTKKKHRSSFVGGNIFCGIYLALYGVLVVNTFTQMIQAQPGTTYIPGGLFWGMSLGLTALVTWMSQTWKKNKVLKKTTPEELREAFAGDVIIQQLKEKAEKENPSLFQKNALVRRFIMEVSGQAGSPALSGLSKHQSLGEQTTETLTQLYFSSNSQVRQKIIQIIQTEQEKQRKLIAG
jgi:hypothetical protein